MNHDSLSAGCIDFVSKIYTAKLFFNIFFFIIKEKHIFYTPRLAYRPCS